MTDLAVALKVYMRLKTNSGEKSSFTPADFLSTSEFSSFSIDVIKSALDELVKNSYADVMEYIQPVYYLI